MKRESYRSIGELLGEYVSENNLEEGLQRVRIFKAWDRVVAAQLAPFMSADKASAMTLSKSFSGGVLRCSMGSSVVRSQLRSQSDNLVKTINNLLGNNAVTKIIFY